MLKTFLYSIGPIALLGYLGKRYFNGGVCTSKNRLDGKIAIITGANCGIGYETALDLSKRGAHVILACRDMKKAKIAADKIIKESNNNKVEIEKLDLADFKSVREFCERIKAKFDRLDILVNNAGLVAEKFALTVDCIETTFQANHLGHFLLTNLLIDLLLKSGSPRVINVSSAAHYNGKMNWEDLNLEKNFSAFKAYEQSKLANVLFTAELAKRYKNDGLISISLHPGVVRTEIMRNIKGIFLAMYYFFLPLIYYAFKNCRQGAQTSIHCAISDDVIPFNGSYFSDCCKKKTNKIDMESAEKLWDISSKLVQLNK